MELRIGELARQSGVGVSTLRAWERRFGFLGPLRSPAGQRIYSDADVERVRAVVRLVGEGLTLPAAIARAATSGTGALPSGEGEELLFGQILEAADQGIWVSRDGRTRYANRRMADIMRCPVEELVAKSVLDFFDLDELPTVRQRTALVRRGQRLHFKQRLRRGDGSAFLAEITTTPLLNPAGGYEGAVAIVEDITDRNEADVHARLRLTLLDAVSDAVAAATPDGRIVYANSVAERLFGWRITDVLGWHGTDLFTAPDVAAEGERILASLVNGKTYSGRLKLLKRDGSQFRAEVSAAPVVDESGKLVGFVAVFSDRTERERVDRSAKTRDLQAETMALLGVQALRRAREPSANTTVLTEAVEATRRLLGADRVLVLDVVTGTDELAVRIGAPAVRERTSVPAGSRSFPGYIALARNVVVVDDTHLDRRFDAPPGSMVRSAAGAPIFGPDGIRGVLIAESSRPQAFDPGDVHFVQGIANIVGTALLREPAE